jgi:biopolymer transport protein ExbD
MAFSVQDDNDSEMLSEINMVPLIDVMLVLLIIFLVTAPLITHSVNFDLPRASSAPQAQKPDAVRLAVNDVGDLYWNDQLLTDDELRARLREIAALTPQPEVHLHADRNTRYQRLAEVMAEVHNAGLTKLGFVTLPNQ